MADDRLIPPSLNDIRGKAFNAIIDQMGTVDLRPLLVYVIDNAPSAALPFLIKQFHVDGYEGAILATNDAAKRALIKNAFALHRKHGTKWAILNMLTFLGYPAFLQEWFEYGGQPYHFQVNIDLYGQSIDAATALLIQNLILTWKNARSVLDNLTFNYSVDSPVPVWAVGLQSSVMITVYPK